MGDWVEFLRSVNLTLASFIPISFLRRALDNLHKYRDVGICILFYIGEIIFGCYAGQLTPNITMPDWAKRVVCIDLTDLGLKDISVLEGLQNLKQARMRGNCVKTLNVFSSWKALEELDLEVRFLVDWTVQHLICPKLFTNCFLPNNYVILPWANQRMAKIYKRNSVQYIKHWMLCREMELRILK